MESSDSGTGVADCSVGEIVWVRRRNGSWWPGKILGADELSASHLMSPRSGTPVKLLGREDASVDWYNLEKSKRVKAFRCGEFDDCIGRAEASQGIPPKKRDKYARREDAILHALELEKQLLEKKYGELGCSSNGTSSVKKDLATSSQNLRNGNGKVKTPKPLRNENKTKNKAHPQVHDNSDVSPQMRGLKEIGPRIKHKVSSPVPSNCAQNHALVDSASDFPNGERNMIVDSKISLDKRKRSNEGHLEESLVKRRDRRRPLVQLLESSAKLLPVVPQSLLCDDDNDIAPSISGERGGGGGGEEKGDVAKSSKFGSLPVQPCDNLEDKETHSGMMEITLHSKFEENSSPPQRALREENHRSGSTEDTETDTSEANSLESDETIGTLSDDSAPIELIPKSMERPEAQSEQECMSRSSEDPDEFAVISDHCPSSPLSASVGVSKWQIKGKRNNRGVTKRLPGKNFSIHKGTLNGSEMYGNDGTESMQNNLGDQMPTGVSRSIIDWDELAWNDEPTLKGYWVDTAEYYEPMFVGGRTNPMLIEIDLKVQSSYAREVPMISLMSKLNGKAIVGHPIPVEPLPSGSTEALLGAPDSYWVEPEMVDQDAAIPPVWRTARRTANCRVPRPQGSHPKTDRKIMKKPGKKMSLSSSPKIRALSSIGIPHKQGSNNSYRQVDGLIKQESIGPTVVACIPVKLVFSRLHEALVDRH